jgi:Tol biopolymer transport system component
VTTLNEERQELWHRWPEFLPDGRHFLYLARSAEQAQDAIYVASLDAEESTRVLAHDSRVVFAPPNHLIFARQQTLVAQPFDLDALSVSGEASAIAEPVARYAPTGEGAFSASESGLAYAARIAIPDSQLTWFDRAGRPLGIIGTTASHRNPALAPDNMRVAVQREDVESEVDDLWVIDAAHGGTSRLTFGNAQNRNPIWSSDGTRVAFAAYTGTTDLYQKPATGGREELLVKTGATGAFPTSWSLDGRLLLYAAAGSKTSYDLWTIALDGDRTPRPLLQSGFIETQGQLSPSGRWVAYTTDETGVREVWVQSVPPTGAKWQVSTDGGSEPRWRGDGGELYYIAGNGTLMAVAINATLAAFQVGSPQPLFQTRRPFSSPLHTNYTPSADGQRFLINTIAGNAPAPTPITMILNWSEQVKRPVPTN